MFCQLISTILPAGRPEGLRKQSCIAGDRVLFFTQILITVQCMYIISLQKVAVHNN